MSILQQLDFHILTSILFSIWDKCMRQNIDDVIISLCHMVYALLNPIFPQTVLVAFQKYFSVIRIITPIFYGFFTIRMRRIWLMSLCLCKCFSKIEYSYQKKCSQNAIYCVICPNATKNAWWNIGLIIIILIILN